MYDFLLNLRWRTKGQVFLARLCVNEARFSFLLNTVLSSGKMTTWRYQISGKSGQRSRSPVRTASTSVYDEYLFALDDP